METLRQESEWSVCALGLTGDLPQTPAHPGDTSGCKVVKIMDTEYVHMWCVTS